MSARKIYLASSWRNEHQPSVWSDIAKLGHDVYDFRNPPNRAGFGWEQLGVGDGRDEDGQVTVRDWREMIAHPIADEGFLADFTAMCEADAFVLLLPCGRSAHLEAGWAIGRGVPTAIYCPEPRTEPELMVKMASLVTGSWFELTEWLERLP